jgi:thioredoxin reductase (NADPH)
MATRDLEYDLLVIGGGPAGLTAAMTAESEGINTLVVDAGEKFGGQAGTSSLIENYPGFPEGLSGEELTARILDQALRYNTEFLAPWRAQSVEKTDGGLVVRDDEETVLARSVLLAAGVHYRPLRGVPNLAAYLGRGVKYGSPERSHSFQGKKLCVIGGANSAGQAAMHLSQQVDCEVNMFVRSNSLSDKMSSYLVKRIVAQPDVISVHTQTEVVGVDGDGRLKEVTVKTGDKVRTMEVDELFILIGAVPKTAWLPKEVARDEHKYIKSGSDIDEATRHGFIESNGRPPLAFETSMKGLFVAGDVRCGSTKRVVAAAAEGALAVANLHRYFEMEESGVSKDV